MVYSYRKILPKIHETVFLTPSSDIIGDVQIGENSSVWFQVVIRGDVNSISIGKDTNIQDGSILHVTHQKAALKIGNQVTVGHSVTLHGCTIGDRVLIGMRAVVMDHVEIGDDCIIGAGSLVTQGSKIPPHSLVLGSPAKVIRQLNAEELAFLKQSAENYKQYVKWYREDGVWK